MISIKFLIIVFATFLLLGCNGWEDSTKILNHSKSKISSPVPSSQINTTVRNPLLLSKDYGQTWIDISQGLPAEIQVSFLEKKKDELVIATDNLGLFVSTDRRTKWKSINQGLPNKKINALHISEESIYVGVYRAGIFISQDNGGNWTSLNFDLPNLSVQAIWKAEDALFVGTDVGIFRLKNGKQKWEKLAISSQVLSIYGYDKKLILGTSQGTVCSHDQGESWEWIRKNGAVHYTHNIEDRIVELGLNGDLYFSDDWGKNWVTSNYEPRDWSYIYELVEVNGYYVMSNNYGIHRSKDQGKTWELIYSTESMAFFDFLVFGQEIYGGTRTWDEYRKR